jgi:ornithine carbamoyltransferase
LTPSFYIARERTESASGIKDLISINDLPPGEVNRILATAVDLKERPHNYSEAMAGRSVALIFEKPSLRTRVTFELGATQLGASSIYLDHQTVQMRERESVKDLGSASFYQ